MARHTPKELTDSRTQSKTRREREKVEVCKSTCIVKGCERSTSILNASCWEKEVIEPYEAEETKNAIEPQLVRDDGPVDPATAGTRGSSLTDPSVATRLGMIPMTLTVTQRCKLSKAKAQQKQRKKTIASSSPLGVGDGARQTKCCPNFGGKGNG